MQFLLHLAMEQYFQWLQPSCFFISFLASVWYGRYHIVTMVRVCNHDVWEHVRFILLTKIFTLIWTYILCFMYCILTMTLQSNDWNFLHWVSQLWYLMCLTSWKTFWQCVLLDSCQILTHIWPSSHFSYSQTSIKQETKHLNKCRVRNFMVPKALQTLLLKIPHWELKPAVSAISQAQYMRHTE
jgi:hypothetical protein